MNALAGTHGANVDAVDRNGLTALMHAAMYGHTDTVNALAGTHGANVDAFNRRGFFFPCQRRRKFFQLSRAVNRLELSPHLTDRPRVFCNGIPIPKRSL